jgi:hypothetical protein
MNRTVKKMVLLLLAAACLFGAGRMQRSLNRDRDALGLTRAAVLENAPPALAFTTVALGGFRGLISNFLWIRANDLQQDDKYFEAAQLAEWITKMEPTYPQVWEFQAWNMAYNISVKFKQNAPGDYTDRWRWVERGIALIRDEGLRYNPNNIDMYQQLGWFFQHKMGANLDDGNRFYKQQWADEMKDFFGPNGTNFDRLLHPQTDADFKQLQVFTNQYKLDPAFAKSVDEKYGPLDWRLPEAHAIYWGAKALDEAAKHPDKVSPDGLTPARRLVLQSLLQAVQHGRIVTAHGNTYLGPNLDLVGSLNQAFLNFIAEEPAPAQKAQFLTAQKNFLRDAVYFLYEHDRISEAQKWFTYLGDRFPFWPIIENQPNSLPKNLTLDEYAFAVMQIDLNELSQDRVTSAIEGLLTRADYALALGDDEQYANLKAMAAHAHRIYAAKTAAASADRVPLPPLEVMNKTVLQRLLDPQYGMPYAARAALVTQLGLPASDLVPDATPASAGDAGSTNSAPTAPATNGTVPAQP